MKEEGSLWDIFRPQSRYIVSETLQYAVVIFAVYSWCSWKKLWSHFAHSNTKPRVRMSFTIEFDRPARKVIRFPLETMHFRHTYTHRPDFQLQLKCSLRILDHLQGDPSIPCKMKHDFPFVRQWKVWEQIWYSIVSFTNYQLKCCAWTHLRCSFLR